MWSNIRQHSQRTGFWVPLTPLNRWFVLYKSIHWESMIKVQVLSYFSFCPALFEAPWLQKTGNATCLHTYRCKLICPINCGLFDKLSTLKVSITTKVVCFCHLLKCFLSFLTNSVDSDQTASAGAVWSGSTLFVPILTFISQIHVMLAKICMPPT